MPAQNITSLQVLDTFRYFFRSDMSFLIYLYFPGTFTLVLVLLQWYCYWYWYWYCYEFSAAGIRSRGPLATVAVIGLIPLTSALDLAAIVTPRLGM